jgi:hypothetical protein
MPEQVVPWIRQAVGFFACHIASPYEEIAEEAGAGIQRVAKVFAGTCDFGIACIVGMEPRSNGPEEKVARIAAFRLAGNVIASVAMVISSLVKVMWGYTLAGICDGDPEVRESAFDFAGEFFGAYANVSLMNELDRYAVVEPVLIVVSEETNARCLAAELRAISQLCLFLGEELQQAAAMILRVLFQIMRSADLTLAADIVGTLRHIAVETGIGRDEVGEFCCQILAQAGECPRRLLLESLETLARLPNETAAMTWQIFQCVLAIAREGSLLSDDLYFLNRILRIFIREKPAPIDAYWFDVSGIVLGRVLEPLETDSALFCHSTQFSDLRPFLKTVQALLQSDFAPRLAEAAPRLWDVFGRVLDSSNDPSLVLTVIASARFLFAMLEPAATHALFEKIAHKVAHFEEPSQFTTAVVTFTKCLRAVPDNSRGPEICDIAVATFLDLVRRSHELIAYQSKLADDISDVRVLDGLYGPLIHHFVGLISSVWEIYGDVSPVPWREQIPKDPSSILCVGVWASYFRLVEVSDEIVSLLCAGLSADAGDFTVMLHREIFEYLRVCVSMRPDLAMETIGQITASTIEWLARHRTWRLSGCAGILLVSVLWAYPERVDTSVVVCTALEALPFLWHEEADILCVTRVLAFFLEEFSAEIARAGEEKRHLVVMALGNAARALGPDCPLEITALMMRSDIQRLRQSELRGLDVSGPCGRLSGRMIV